MRQDEERRQEEKEIIANLKVFSREESAFIVLIKVLSSRLIVSYVVSDVDKIKKDIRHTLINSAIRYPTDSRAFLITQQQ